MDSIDTDGGVSVGKDVRTHGGSFTGRDKKHDGQQVTINNYEDQPPHSSPPPPTTSQVVWELNRKVDEILDYIKGNPDRDIKGIRPRMKEIEQRLTILMWLMGALFLIMIAVAAGVHW